MITNNYIKKTAIQESVQLVSPVIQYLGRQSRVLPDVLKYLIFECQFAQIPNSNTYNVSFVNGFLHF